MPLSKIALEVVRLAAEELQTALKDISEKLVRKDHNTTFRELKKYLLVWINESFGVYHTTQITHAKRYMPVGMLWVWMRGGGTAVLFNYTSFINDVFPQELDSNLLKDHDRVLKHASNLLTNPRYAEKWFYESEEEAIAGKTHGSASAGRTAELNLPPDIAEAISNAERYLAEKVSEFLNRSFNVMKNQGKNLIQLKAACFALMVDEIKKLNSGLLESEVPVQVRVSGLQPMETGITLFFDIDGLLNIMGDPVMSRTPLHAQYAESAITQAVEKLSDKNFYSRYFIIKGSLKDISAYREEEPTVEEKPQGITKEMRAKAKAMIVDATQSFFRQNKQGIIEGKIQFTQLRELHETWIKQKALFKQKDNDFIVELSKKLRKYLIAVSEAAIGKQTSNIQQYMDSYENAALQLISDYF